jgi:hypothetical protein
LGRDLGTVARDAGAARGKVRAEKAALQVLVDKAAERFESISIAGSDDGACAAAGEWLEEWKAATNAG